MTSSKHDQSQLTSKEMETYNISCYKVINWQTAVPYFIHVAEYFRWTKILPSPCSYSTLCLLIQFGGIYFYQGAVKDNVPGSSMQLLTWDKKNYFCQQERNLVIAHIKTRKRMDIRISGVFGPVNFQYFNVQPQILQTCVQSKGACPKSLQKKYDINILPQCLTLLSLKCKF